MRRSPLQTGWNNDYNSTPQIIIFAPNETSKIVTVPIVNDTLIEGTEYFSATLNSPTNGSLIGTQSTAKMYIQDDEVVIKSDFNSNGKSDILWRNPLTGYTGLWLMDGGNQVSTSQITTASTNFQVQGLI